MIVLIIEIKYNIRNNLQGLKFESKTANQIKACIFHEYETLQQLPIWGLVPHKFQCGFIKSISAAPHFARSVLAEFCSPTY